MKLLNIIISTVLISIIVGCKPISTVSQSTPSSIVQPILPDTPFVSQTAAVEPTKTDTAAPLPTETKAPTHTSTPTVDLKIRDEPITPVEFLSTIPEGQLVLAESISLWTTLELLNLRTNELVSLGESFVPYAVSTDNKQLAFISQDNDLKIVNTDGEIIKSIAVSINWRGVIRWIDDERLLIEDMPLHSDGSYNPPASSIVFNISDEESERQYLHDYPGQFYVGNGAPEWGPYHFTQAVFDPGFTRVVYPAWDTIEDDQQLGGFPLVLWDMENQSELLRIRSLDPNYGGLPLWEKDGSHFVTGIQPIFESKVGIIENIPDSLPYQSGMELCLISRNGDIERLTFLTTEHNAQPEGFVFSPDEKRIAFWLKFTDQPDYWNAVSQLAILNTDSGEITNLQLTVGDYPHQPVWSPDGRTLAVTVSDIRNSLSDVYIVDLEQGLSMKIAENAVATGWLFNDEP